MDCLPPIEGERAFQNGDQDWEPDTWFSILGAYSSSQGGRERRRRKWGMLAPNTFKRKTMQWPLIIHFQVGDSTHFEKTRSVKSESDPWLYTTVPSNCGSLWVRLCSEPFARTAHLLDGPGPFTRPPLEHMGRACLLGGLSSKQDGRQVYGPSHLLDKSSRRWDRARLLDKQTRAMIVRVIWLHLFYISLNDGIDCREDVES